jgi:hypothetical protein
MPIIHNGFQLFVSIIGSCPSNDYMAPWTGWIVLGICLEDVSNVSALVSTIRTTRCNTCMNHTSHSQTRQTTWPPMLSTSVSLSTTKNITVSQSFHQSCVQIEVPLSHELQEIYDTNANHMCGSRRPRAGLESEIRSRHPILLQGVSESYLCRACLLEQKISFRLSARVSFGKNSSLVEARALVEKVLEMSAHSSSQNSHLV